ncbi:hypothetical protein O181_083016 [Austropuccinia psidii MF-1]|uniref:Uncharacterized protein n=1 Tax=Austropuccinia psidii MF-1 TaxID=1389203 RepID=A0A9Q3FN93_9BASI|nr:hypothetical protein [Austropuccinia psidii MF-1]
MRLSRWESSLGPLAIFFLPLFDSTLRISAAQHKVAVGKNGQTFEPSSISAAKGDTVIFVFYQNDHTVTQTHFDKPCSGLNPPSDSFCTSPDHPKSDSNSIDSAIIDYPSFADPAKRPTNSYDSASIYPIPAPGSSDGELPALEAVDNPTKVSTAPLIQNLAKPLATSLPDPMQVPPQCNCPSVPIPWTKPPNSFNPYPTQPDTPSPQNSNQTSCDSKCIDVAGECQMSTNCNLQANSPAETKCKIQDGVCKKCANELSKFKHDSVDQMPPPPSKLLRRTLPSDHPNSSPPSGKTAKLIKIGLDSGVVHVQDDKKDSGLTWKVKLTEDSKPLWFMSGGLNECSSGMVFAINPPQTGDNTFDKFLQAAKYNSCPTAYPSTLNFQGDGCTASENPAPSQTNDKKDTPTNNSPAPPTTSGEEQPSSPPSTSGEAQPSSPPSTSGEAQPPPQNDNPSTPPSNNSTPTQPATPDSNKSTPESPKNGTESSTTKTTSNANYSFKVSKLNSISFLYMLCLIFFGLGILI